MTDPKQPDNEETIGDDQAPSEPDDPTLIERDDSDTVIEPNSSVDKTIPLPGTSDDATVIESDGDEQTVVEPVAPEDPDATIGDERSADDATMVDRESDQPTIVEPDSTAKDPDDVETLTDEVGPDADNAATLITQDSGSDSDRTLVSASMPEGAPGSPSLKTLERFELIRVLGQGAFGTVYLGRDPQLDRQVAIKVAKTGVLNSKSDIDRFNREARAAANLRHPNIVPVYEAGQTRGSTYIVYEFVEGKTLKQVLRDRGQLPPAEAAALTIKIARAMEYAHSSGIIHRDIKPENILMDPAGEPHIADFGLARNEGKDATQTREGTLMGTPAYMSPEQASGKISLIDRRSDVWSLGIMLDEMLTARRIYSGTVVEVLTAVKNEPVKPIRSADASLPIDLETICLKALEKDQSTRFQTAGAFADELELWSKGEPITLRRISPIERLYRWAKRNQTIAALLATVIFTLVAGTLVSAKFAIDASNRAKQLTEEQLERIKVQLTNVLTAEPEAVPVLLDELDSYDIDLLSIFKELPVPAEARKTRRPLLIARLSSDPKERKVALDELRVALLKEDVDEFLVLRNELQPEQELLSPELWKTAENPDASYDTRLHAAAALALYEPDSEQWDGITDAVVSQLLSTLSVSDWARAFYPVRERLKDSLFRVFTNQNETTNRQDAANVLAYLFADSPDVLVQLIRYADKDQLGVLVSQLENKKQVLKQLTDRLEKQYPDPITSDQQEIEDQQRANHVIALLETGQVEAANSELKNGLRNGVRAHVIDRAAKARLNQNILFRTLITEDNPHVLRTAILALADYGEGDIDQTARIARAKDLLRLYRNHPDAGVHGAVEYVMRRWNLDTELEAVARELQSAEWPKDGRRWHHAPSGLVFAIIRNPPPFIMGTDDPIRGDLAAVEETPHRRTIDRSYAISMTEVTIGQFRAFKPSYKNRYSSATGRHPVSFVSWHEAADFCNWLSANDDLDLAYSKTSSSNTVVPKDIVKRVGYRLPTRAEWEYAARAGAPTLRHFGGGITLLNRYGWTSLSNASTPQRVGSLLPNEFGLVDTLGNVSEWTQSWSETKDPTGSDIIDGNEGEPGQFTMRQHAGRSFREPPNAVVEAARWEAAMQAFLKDTRVGFRVVRTLPQVK